MAKKLPIRKHTEPITFSRNPTVSEIKFGYGATHYLDFEPKDYLKKDGTVKKRIKNKVDGLIYTRSTH